MVEVKGGLDELGVAEPDDEQRRCQAVPIAGGNGQSLDGMSLPVGGFDYGRLAMMTPNPGRSACSWNGSVSANPS